MASTLRAIARASLTLIAISAGVAHAAPLATCPSSGNRVTVAPSGLTDGTDTSHIQAAINSMTALSGGGTVLLSGTYNLPSATLSIKPNVTLCAANRATLKRTASTFGYILDTGATDDVANNTGIVNLTFDGGPVALRGSNLRVESNIFQNVNRTAGEKAANVDAFGRFGLWLRAASASNVINNDFINLEYGGIFGHSISSSTTISGNTFSTTLEPIHLFCVSNSTISNNTMSQFTRMGIEVQRDPNPTEPAKFPACTTNPSVTISRNVMQNWATSSPQQLITAISTEKITGTVGYNTVTCGAACNNLDPAINSLGLEISTAGSTAVASNTVTGFNVGIQINDADSLGVVNNALYSNNIGIVKANNAPATGSLTINRNYIVNARASAIDGAWDLTTNPVISANTIIRVAGQWANDNTRSGDASYIAIKGGNTAAGSQPLSIKNNTVLFLGTAVSGFETRGVMLTGTPAGLTIDSNWFGWIGNSSQTAYGNGIQINNGDASNGVVLSNNVFQGLSLLTLGWECKFSASGNNAINMSSLGQYCAAPLASPYQMAIPLPTSTITTATGTTPGGYVNGRTFSAAIPSGFTFRNWAFGNGTGRITYNPDTEWFYSYATRLGVVFATGANGALTAKETWYTN